MPSQTQVAEGARCNHGCPKCLYPSTIITHPTNSYGGIPSPNPDSAYSVHVHNGDVYNGQVNGIAGGRENTNMNMNCITSDREEVHQLKIEVMVIAFNFKPNKCRPAWYGRRKKRQRSESPRNWQQSHSRARRQAWRRRSKWRSRIRKLAAPAAWKSSSSMVERYH